jgi:tetratricopeptide (TPR) repeat protein
MNWNSVLKYVLYSMIASSVLSFGCTSSKISKEVKLEGIAQEEQSKLVEEPGAEKVVDLEKIVKIAESHYEKGYAYYKERKWALAEQEFDRALRTLLDADVDAETHYKLGKAYDSLFYNIHKIELEESFLRGVLSQKPMSDEEVLSAAPSQPSPEVLTTKDTAKEKEQIPESADNSLGEIVINEADPEIQKYVKQFSPERSQFRTGMERGTKYLPMIQNIFQS